jgi:hypothetical protein
MGMGMMKKMLGPDKPNTTSALPNQ